MSDQQTQNQRRGAPVGDRPSSATLSTRFGRIGIDIQNVEMFQQLLNLVGVIYADRKDLRPLIFDSLLVFDLAGNAQHQMAAWEDLQLDPDQLDVLADVLASVDDARETFGTEHILHPLLNAVHRLIDSAAQAGV
ncbi:hypothetical protein JJB07_14810 [Tumebacillus sp. ITR2]|uniref:Uncharacterized protein n=1 Tax=Tumebacillus amylolyticus TaxID=2801339 RepID=A0ABS1JCA4_9BACL|nr:hypothetical protein [Tumebacillus amylolyticus]MBL0387909.1 hypothetical protein [Tumebacillus amylolyticus]